MYGVPFSRWHNVRQEALVGLGPDQQPPTLQVVLPPIGEDLGSQRSREPWISHLHSSLVVLGCSIVRRPEDILHLMFRSTTCVPTYRCNGISITAVLSGLGLAYTPSRTPRCRGSHQIRPDASEHLASPASKSPSPSPGRIPRVKVTSCQIPARPSRAGKHATPRQRDRAIAEHRPHPMTSYAGMPTSRFFEPGGTSWHSQSHGTGDPGGWGVISLADQHSKWHTAMHYAGSMPWCK